VAVLSLSEFVGMRIGEREAGQVIPPPLSFLKLRNSISLTESGQS